VLTSRKREEDVVLTIEEILVDAVLVVRKLAVVVYKVGEVQLEELSIMVLQIMALLLFLE